MFESFKDLVRSRRKDKLKKSEEELFNGAFWSGKTAVKIGLVDAIGNMRNVMNKKYGNKIKFVTIQIKKKGILRELLSQRLDGFSSNLTGNIINKIEEKSCFNKFGL